MKISIITVNLNNAEGLKATLESVAMQSYKEFEHIIIDGGSSDGSVPVIKSYEESIIANRFNHKTQYPLISWKSERDGGIYDAMNKGVKNASGKYLYFLNSGDTLSTPFVIKEMIESLDGSDILIGRVNMSFCGKIVDKTALLSEKDMSLYYMYLHGINHQSAIIKRDLLVETPYDTSIKLGADWKFFVQTIVLSGVTVKFLDFIFTNYDISGISSNTEEVKRERDFVLNTIVPKRIACDYLAILPNYYEVVRVQWLLNHPLWYKIYRWITSFARKINK